MQLQRLRVDPPRLQPQLLLQRRGGYTPPGCPGMAAAALGGSTPPAAICAAAAGVVDPKAPLHPPNCGPSVHAHLPSVFRRLLADPLPPFVFVVTATKFEPVFPSKGALLLHWGGRPPPAAAAAAAAGEGLPPPALNPTAAALGSTPPGL